MPSVSSDVDNVISNTPDADGSSQEMFRSTPVDENHVYFCILFYIVVHGSFAQIGVKV